MAETKPTLVPDEVAPIAKPAGFDLDKFKSKRAAARGQRRDAADRRCRITSISQAKDFVRLHPDEENYWSPELCFVNVPIKGQKHDTLHLIDEDLAMQYLPSGRIQRFRLALATKPYDVVLSLPRADAEHRQPVEREQPGGLRAGEDAVGASHQPQARRASTATRSTSRANRMPSPSRSGRRNRSVN